MRPRRDHFIEFVHHNVTTIRNHPLLPTLSLLLLVLGTESYQRLVNIGFIIICVFIIGHSFLLWYYKRYEFQDGSFLYTNGVFHRTFNHVPYQNVRSIYLTDTWFKRLIGLSNLHIELLGGEEIHFVLHNRDILTLRQTFFQEWSLHPKTKSSQRFRIFEYWLLSTTNLPLFLTALSLTLTIISFVLRHFSVHLGLETAQEHEQSLNDTRGLWEIMSFEGSAFLEVDYWLPILMGMGFIFLITMLFTVLMSYITYRGFSLQKRESDYEVTYGWLKRNQYVLPTKNIRSLRIVEPFMFRLLGYVQVKMDHIGLNEQASNQLYVAPVLKKEHLEAYLSEWFPQFSNSASIESPKRQALFHFLWERPFIWAVFITILGIEWSFFYYGYWLIPILLLYGYHEWRNEGLAYDTEFIINRYLNKLTVVTVITQSKHVESTTFSQSFFTKKQGFGTFSYAVYSEMLEEVYSCRGLSDDRQREFLSYLKTKPPEKS
ncbi:PH domain-containing protein [Bacillus sp. PS06]|uniref:PH domain-containing protein n=1 Tax=Bacillus sp. PS06 TaxID=2764176 RepID=UPI00177F8F1C|nr:PH domain-containing protein [Bacillus sp. PS06]MBD8070664.1 PH domain-containing protein [Bacillus sp. PS06]